MNHLHVYVMLKRVFCIRPTFVFHEGVASKSLLKIYENEDKNSLIFSEIMTTNVVKKSLKILIHI